MKHMRRAIELLLPVSIFSFLLYYYCCYFSCLPSSLYSITSLLQSAKRFATRKAAFLLIHAILLLLAITSRFAAIASDDEYITRNMDDHFLSLQPVRNTDGLFLPLRPDDCLELQVLQYPVEKTVTEESVVLHSSSYVSTKTFTTDAGSHLLLLTDSVEVEDELVVEKEALGGSATGLLVEELEDQGNIVEVEEMELVIVDDLELLHMDELNRRFDEFIEREKKRRSTEANLQLIMV